LKKLLVKNLLSSHKNMFAPRHDLSNYERWTATLQLSLGMWVCMAFWAAPVFELAVIEYNNKANWQEWFFMTSFGFGVGGVLPSLFPES